MCIALAQLLNMLGAFDDRSTLLATIAGSCGVSCAYCFEISPFYFVDFKTFRTVATSQFIFGNSQMTVPATQPVLFSLDQREHFVFTGIHDLFYILNNYMYTAKSIGALLWYVNLKYRSQNSE